MVRRAWVRIGASAGLAVCLLIGLIGAIAYLVIWSAQEQQIEQELSRSITAADPSGPPNCTWKFVLRDGVLSTGRVPPPTGFPLRGDMERVAAGGPASKAVVARERTVYHVRTERRGAEVVQVVFDSRYQLADRRHLLLALTLAALVGTIASVVTGLIVGRQAVQPLAEALTRQRRFVSDASHELKTPIAQVHTRAQLLARRVARQDASPEQQADIEKLVGATRRLGEIVDELLLSARLAGRRTPAPGLPVDLAALAEAAASTDVDRAAERGVTLTLTRPDRPVVVAGVESALRRVVAELVTNALRHTPAGGRIEVTVRAGDRAELVVSDTGDGFHPADAELLFDRFHRGVSDERRFGLGLALLREVVTDHGGTITAEGEPGRGATFTVRLPVLAVPATDPAFTHSRSR